METNSSKKKSKRVRRPESHRRNIVKICRQTGKSYISRSGKLVPGKEFRPQPECNCRVKCHEKISVARQEQIYNYYYSLMSDHKKKQFIMGQVTVKPVKTKVNELRAIIDVRPKTYSRDYHFEDENGVSQSICKVFFMNCLHINSAMIHRALVRYTANGLPPKDGRCGKPPPNKTSPEDKKFIVEFIELFPTYELYNTETQTNKMYLPSNLNVRIMYDQYKEYCIQMERPALSMYIFRHAFKTEFNLAFAPKKDGVKKGIEQSPEINSQDTVSTDEQEDEEMETQNDPLANVQIKTEEIWL